MRRLRRRNFLKAVSALPAAVPFLSAQDSAPLIDIHQHTRYQGRSDEQLLAHQAYNRVTKTILLPGEGWMLSVVGDNSSCAALEARYPSQFRRFTCSDPAESRTADLVGGNIRRGAIGIGELKFHVAVDSPEMQRVYRLAEEWRVPVLIHFEYENYNTGFERFAAVLKTYHKVNFIGHAQTWWGNISAELNPLDLYPKGHVKPGGLTVGGSGGASTATVVWKPGSTTAVNTVPLTTLSTTTVSVTASTTVLWSDATRTRYSVPRTKAVEVAVVVSNRLLGPTRCSTRFQELPAS